MVARMSTNQSLLSLRAERDRLSNKLVEAENLVGAIRGELRGIDKAIAILKGLEQQPSEEQPPGERLSRGALKDAVLGMLERQREGLRASDVIDLARSRGQILDRGSVASLLSRLNRDGVLEFNRESRRYSVKRNNAADDGWGSARTAA